MMRRRVTAATVPALLEPGLARLRAELEVSVDFPEEVEAQAARLLSDPPQFPGYRDRTEIEFVTVDPSSSRDLDQAACLSRDGDGFLIHYAIADVGAWIRPGSALDVEAWRRGETLYAPGAKVPLHPRALSEEAGSLLADGRPRPAVLWTHRLAADGSHREVQVERAMVRSRAKLSYSGVQADLEAGRAHPSIELLPEVGRLRQEIEAARGGISLNLPDQEIVAANGTWRTEFRTWLPVEDYNAQLSLMTGMAAAEIMLGAGVGVLRTLPNATQREIDRLRWSSRSLGVPWPKGISYPEYVRGLDPGQPRQLAVLARCASLFRGASYQILEGQPLAELNHAALGAPYAHVTAPLRRLVDRYAAEVCVRVVNGDPVPEWTAQGLAELPEVMNRSNRRAKTWERQVLGLAEALVLQPRIGESFDAVLLDVNPKTGWGIFQVKEPAIEARLPVTGLKAGSEIRVRLDGVDLTTAELSFSQLG